jgi:hypothetical protein
VHAVADNSRDLADLARPPARIEEMDPRRHRIEHAVAVEVFVDVDHIVGSHVFVDRDVREIDRCREVDERAIGCHWV